jgi:hypothetical protein
VSRLHHAAENTVSTFVTLSTHRIISYSDNISFFIYSTFVVAGRILFSALKLHVIANCRSCSLEKSQECPSEQGEILRGAFCSLAAVSQSGRRRKILKRCRGGHSLTLHAPNKASCKRPSEADGRPMHAGKCPLTRGRKRCREQCKHETWKNDAETKVSLKTDG